jgi:hypothetical protein
MKINFISNRPWLNKKSKTNPEPSVKNIPDWYIKESRYVKDDLGNYTLDQYGHKVPSWKGCPAIYDIIGTGYVLKTPCDIEFYQDGDDFKVKLNKRYSDFIQYRPDWSLHGFPKPEGYRKDHFAWWPDWAIEVPDGYSVLYSQPFNRFDLPFLNTTGIVDNDKVNLPGTMPFFVREGWEGVIKQGTPYLQILPFKREDWDSDYIFPDEYEMYEKNMKNIEKYRVPGGGVYLNQVWSKRRYS